MYPVLREWQIADLLDAVVYDRSAQFWFHVHLEAFYYVNEIEKMKVYGLVLSPRALNYARNIPCTSPGSFLDANYNIPFPSHPVNYLSFYPFDWIDNLVHFFRKYFEKIGELLVYAVQSFPLGLDSSCFLSVPRFNIHMSDLKCVFYAYKIVFCGLMLD